jgi:hypothetical protein
MSGGQRIDDHSFWAGGRSKGSIFPEGAKVKEQNDSEGSGAVSKYEDTSEAIHGTQMEAKRKVAKHASKFDYRN